MITVLSEKFRRKYKKEGETVTREYQIEIGLKPSDGEFPQFVVTASGRTLPHDDWDRLDASIEIDFERRQAIVTVPGLNELNFVINLEDLDIGEDADFEEAWRSISSNIVEEGDMTAEVIETALQTMPVDPVFGCIIKSAVSTSVGQSLRCYGYARREERRLRQTFRCLGDNMFAIVRKTSRRTITCMIFVGLA